MYVALSPWLDLLRCPRDGGELEVSHKAQPLNKLTEGTLICSLCQHGYAVRNGIISFLEQTEDSGLDDDRKRQEMQVRDAAAATYDSRHSEQRLRLEMPPCLAAMRCQPDDVVAELGCGTGKFTVQYAEHVKRVVAIDFSLESLRVLQRRLPEEVRPRVLLLQADVCNLPLVAGGFSQIVSFQVLEHLPTPEHRQQAFAAATACLRPGGTLTCSVYNWSQSKRQEQAKGQGDNTAKEGYHASGIYYYNFEADELRGLLDKAGLRLELLRGLMIPIRGARLLGNLVVPLNRLLSRTRIGLTRGHLLLARARRSESSAA